MTEPDIVERLRAGEIEVRDILDDEDIAFVSELLTEAAAEIQSLRTRLEGRAGWQLVPVKPTEAMRAAGNGIDSDDCSPVWDAMLAAAAPTSPDSRGGE